MISVRHGIRKKPRLTASRLLVLMILAALTGCSQDDGGIALGTVERDRITLSATAAERITAQPLAEGSNVDAGALVVQLDTTRQQAAVNRAEADVRQIQAIFDRLNNGSRAGEIAAARSRLEAARATLQDSERETARITQLVERKLMPSAELDSIQSLTDVHRANVAEAGEQLDLLISGAREEEIREALSRLDAARALLQLEEFRLQELSLTAPVDGRLDTLPWQTGERVQPGSPVAVIVPNASPFARVYVPEPYLASVPVGTTLQVMADGVAMPFSGSVRWLSSEPAFTPWYALNQQERSRLVFLAEITLDDSASDLPSGLPVQVMLP